MTTTRQDIIDQTILPAIASGDFGQDTTARTAEIIEINREVGDQHFDLVLVRDGSEVVAEVWVESSEESEPYDAAVAQYGPLTWLQNSL